MLRDEILEAARKCVSGERDQQYGGPENNFALIAALWNIYLTARPVDPSGVPRGLTASDVAAMMALLKIARIKRGNAVEDSYVDLAGYAACGGELGTEWRRFQREWCRPIIVAKKANEIWKEDGCGET